MVRSTTSSRRWQYFALGWVVGVAACAGHDTLVAAAEDVAVSGGGVTVDVVTTNVWNGGFNGAVRITDTAFPSPITAFEVRHVSAQQGNDEHLLLVSQSELRRHRRCAAG